MFSHDDSCSYYSEAIVGGTAVCKKDDSFFGGAAPLPLGAGYGIVLGFGLFFSFFTTGLVYLDMKYGGTKISSEFFNTAGRTVKTGLTAAVIVSQWTWAATLLQSSNVAWAYGVSGPFWCVGRRHAPALGSGARARSLPPPPPRPPPPHLALARCGRGMIDALAPRASQVRERRDDSDPPLRHPRDRD